MTANLSVPSRNSHSQSPRFSRHRISTTPPPNDVFEEDDLISEESDEEYNDSTVQLLFNKIYVDPLQDVFECIDGEAGNILRTGKFSVVGDTGNMDLVQPLLFSLQATEENLTLLLPQLMQNPFFNPTQSFSSSDILSAGHIRLGVSVDTVIYNLLSSFCCKGPGSKQADALIATALKTAYTLPTGSLTFQYKCQNSPPLLPIGYIMSSAPVKEESEPESDSSEEDVTFSAGLTKNPSQSSISSRSSGLGSSTRDRSSTAHEYPEIPGISVEDIPIPSIRRCRSSSSSAGGRKHSTAGLFPWSPIALDNGRRDSQDSCASILGDNQWQVELDPPAKDMIVGGFSENSYSILMWNPKLQVQFEVGSEENMSRFTYCASSSKPIVSLYVLNDQEESIAFSVRAYRQSLMFRSHVIYPRVGLHILNSKEEFQQDFDVVGIENIKRDDHIIIDLMVCKLDGEPSWNLQRRYVILKFDEEKSKPLHQNEQRLLNKLFEGGYPVQPGQHKDLGSTLKQVILHGLQSVVKNKLEEAEIIFTQALHLPLFQRVPLKAFAYICLAVIADKRRKKISVSRVNHIFKLVKRLDELLDACESTAAPQLQMPKMIGLIRQLKKELNLQKILDTYRKDAGVKKVKRFDITKTVTSAGDLIKLDETSIVIPKDALTNDTKVTLSNMSRTEIHQALQNSPWASMLSVVSAFNICCSPPIVQFNYPIISTITLKEDQPSPRPPFRLLQSNYLNNWADITDDPNTMVTVSDSILTVKTSHTGWLLVATMCLDISQIMQMAMKSVFSEEPVTLQVNVFGRMVPGNSAEITAYLTPATKEDSTLNQKKEPPSDAHKQISYPHSFKAYKGQRIRLELQGNFENKGYLVSEHIIDGQLETIMSKDAQFASSKSLNGKLVISKYCNVHGKWEIAQEVGLSLSSLLQQNGLSVGLNGLSNGFCHQYK